MNIIHTHGEGELFEKTLQAIGSILYGNPEDQTFHALVRIALVIGGFSALLLAFFRQKFEPLIRNFLLPSLLVVALLLVPKTTVAIQDHETGTRSKPIATPFFLGKFASLTSFSFHHLHQLFQTSIGHPYPWIHQINANENWFLHKSAIEPLLRENIGRFCRECVFHDIGLGLYTKEDLKNDPHLIEFLSAHTSSQRAIPLSGEVVSCQKAIEDLQEELLSQPIAMPLSPSKEEILPEQKLLIDILQEEIFHPASKPSAKPSLGAQGVIVWVSIQKLLHALLYLIFPLILLLSLLSFGLRIALLWIKSIIWVSMWPLFYVSIDLFLDAFWHHSTKHWPFNLENAMRLADLYANIELIGCAALFCIPLISWILLKGGISQLISIPIISSPSPAPTISIEPVLPQPITQEEVQKPNGEDGFKTVVEESKQDEKGHALQNNLSSIRESVKSSSLEISKSLKPIDPHPLPSPNHIPSYGSWNE